ncbi:hypothetical protein [Candidatus Palauibacter sp.]|uniref:hypothetical protein n=1 Tax=Candidatus Palauibacter sp. TaxID=3101350 RepID=UPI003B5CF17D
MAEPYFNKWYFRATHSRLKPVIDAAKTIKRPRPENFITIAYLVCGKLNFKLPT